MLRQVYDAQKEDIRKGGFVDQVKKDLKELDEDFNEDEIRENSKLERNFVDENIKEAAFNYMSKENSTMAKTKEIVFDELYMSEYNLITKKVHSQN